MGNKYWPKCSDALQLGSKGRYSSFYLWINVWVAGCWQLVHSDCLGTDPCDPSLTHATSECLRDDKDIPTTNKALYKCTCFFTLPWRCLAEERVSSRWKTFPEIPKFQFWEMQSKGPFTLCADTCRSVQMRVCVDTRLSTVIELIKTMMCSHYAQICLCPQTSTPHAQTEHLSICDKFLPCYAMLARYMPSSCVCHKLVFYLKER